MAEKKRGVFVGLIVGLWNLLNFTRQLVFNIIFLVLLIFFVVALRSGAGTLHERSALVLDPKGRTVQHFTGQPEQLAFASAFGENLQELQLRDIQLAIDAATKDARIERI